MNVESWRRIGEFWDTISRGIALQVTAAAEFKSVEETIAKLKSSPEVMRAIANLQSRGIDVKAGSKGIDVENERSA